MGSTVIFHNIIAISFLAWLLFVSNVRIAIVKNWLKFERLLVFANLFLLLLLLELRRCLVIDH